MLCNMETGVAIHAVIFPQFYTVTVLICGQLCVCVPARADAAQFESVQTHPEWVRTVTASINEAVSKMCISILYLFT